MKYTVAVALVSTMLLTSCSAQSAKDNQRLRQDIVGTWYSVVPPGTEDVSLDNRVVLKIDGTSITKEFVVPPGFEASSLTSLDTRRNYAISTNSAGKEVAVETFSYRLVPDTTPAGIDLTLADILIKGIVRVESNRLTIAYRQSATGTRPTDFKKPDNEFKFVSAEYERAHK